MAQRQQQRYALTKHQFSLPKQNIMQQSIYHGLPLTWQERQQQEQKDRFYKKLANYCFMVEAMILIGILWMVVPNVIEELF